MVNIFYNFLSSIKIIKLQHNNIKKKKKKAFKKNIVTYNKKILLPKRFINVLNNCDIEKIFKQLLFKLND